jgi:Phosphate transport regulator (distant homolog of PhoU)
MGIREWVIPQDKIFFDQFERLTAVVMEAADDLVLLVEDYTDVKTKIQKIEALEHEGDRITHEIYEQLNVTFITPMEPQEISRLASALDDILDYIDGTTQKMYNYGITETDSHMRELAKLIRLSVTELNEAVRHIRSIKDPRLIEQRCIEVNRLENLADDVLAHAITDLFKTQDAVTIIKLKDIYDYLEVATDKCEDAANVLSDIAIRHS